MGMTETIKVEYNGYTGYAYGASSFSIRDKNDKEILHTGFLTNRPTNEAECLQILKEMLDLLTTSSREQNTGMPMANWKEQALMDALYGKSYDDRWHTVVSDIDLEEFELLANRETTNGNDNN